ncbi:MAG: esterase family protein [Dactylosporangium sp.]|nr:esterase family protein [Dactylosporangium sp.]NNJ61539.1 esterase family protein [Dactylosporangium sp.]
MALVSCDFFSDVLGLSTSMTVILPQETTAQIGMRGAVRAADHPTLYLLHGLSDDHTIWLRRTSIERYVASLGLAVVMPQVHRSFYADEVHGHRYWTFLTTELPALTRSFFRLSDRREDTFVAGLSMGGYGALKWALRQPECFAAAASLSGALDVARLQRGGASDGHLMARVFGTHPIAGTDNDLMALLGRAERDATILPRLYACCGTEDFLQGHSVAFRDTCDRLGIPATVDVGPGEHEWGYWDSKIQDVLDWLPLP